MPRLNLHLVVLVSFCLLQTALPAQERHVVLGDAVVTVDSIRKQPRYQAMHPLDNKILHTKLDVQFNWEKRQVIGEATLFVNPHYFDQDSLILDAKGFEVASISRLEHLNKIPLKFQNTEAHLRIALDRTFTKKDTFAVHIQYTAIPDNRTVETTEGRRAITDDKGLYFINPDGKDPLKPRQIWTQGQPESNSNWFPTIDKPNQRMTHELTLTVDTGMVTLSNGYLDFSVVHGNGLRTDYWIMDQPHAPYLTMLAVGDFTIIPDEGPVPVNYYLEKDYAAYARMIFGETPEMIAHFSELLGVSYPWNKYSQVVVRDYVSGAMENTTAVIFGEFMNMDDKQLHDNPMYDIIAHELFHHWFGDLVTCRSWANLPLNESFATYGEILWREYKHGIDVADYARHRQLRSYLYDYTYSGAKDMIRFDYEDPNDMFDGHSYAKGGRILHMLRNLTGDQVFFESLKTYLTDNMYQSVEIHQLRQAFEKVTGRDWNPFFDQWFLASGHPIVEVTYEWLPAEKTLAIHMRQTQDLSRHPLFDLPIPIDIHQGKNTRREVLRLHDQKQTFKISLKNEPDWIHLDPESVLLAIWNEEVPDSWLLQRATKATRGMARQQHLNKYLNLKPKDVAKVITNALEDPFWYVRLTAMDHLDQLDEKDRQGLRKIMFDLAANDPDPSVRANAIDQLRETYFAKDLNLANKALKAPSYRVMSAGLAMLVTVDAQVARDTAMRYLDHRTAEMRNAAWNALAEAAHPDDYDRFVAHLESASGRARLFAVTRFGRYLSNAQPARQETGIAYLSEAARDADDPRTRYAAIQGLVKIYEKWELDLQTRPMTGVERKALPRKINTLREQVDALKAAETNPDIRARYGLSND
jgi:aminopeptidase N